MDKIYIDIDENNNCYILTGSVINLIEIRRAKHYLRNLNAIVSEKKIIVNYEKENEEKVIQRIRKILSLFEFGEEISSKMLKVLERFFEEEEGFKVFSKQANDIRNNELSEEQKIEFNKFKNILTEKLPNRRLYPLQLLSAYHMTFSQNSCNFSVPGAGKTSVVYGAFAYLKSLQKDELKHVDKLIIIGPLSSFGPWELEFQACFGDQPDSKRLSGGVPRDERISHFLSSNPAEITLMSYQGVPGTIEYLINFLKRFDCMVVLDEAHKIKNTEGGILASSALSIAKYCRSRVILTGTPAPNGYEDIYNLYKFIWPTKNIISFNNFQLKNMSKRSRDSRIPKLIDEIKPYFIRIKKTDLGIPEPIIHPEVIVSMGEVQREIYDFIENDYMDHLDSHNRSGSFQSSLVRARLIRLMQVSTNPSLLRKPLDQYYSEQGLGNSLYIDDSLVINKIMEYSNLETPRKFIEAKKIIENIIGKGEKVIVWTNFIKNILDFQLFLKSSGIKSEAIWGETPVDRDDLPENILTREKIISKFHDSKSDFKVLIANPFAIAESISLHKVCHNAIYIERSFNAGNFIQSKDRIHRYGLDDNDEINYYYLVSDNNIDRTIHQRLMEKEKRMMEIIESEDIPLFGILDDKNASDQDIRALINNYVSNPIIK
jgi:hypothetical protein